MSTRVETRFIVRNSNGVYGVTYRWAGSTTNATLVPESGMDDYFVINNGGILTTQDWHYPSRNECLACHTSLGGLGLGFNTAQLNCGYNYTNAGVATNQIKALSDAGYFTTNITNINLLPALASATNSAVSLEYRVRSYVAANCSQCHQPGGSGNGFWDARISTPGPQCSIVNGALVNILGDTNNRVIAPGSLSNSVMYNRVANFGTLHMPPLATTVVNTQAVQLLSAWITNDLPSYRTYNAWAASYFGTNTNNVALLQDYDGDNARNYLEYLTGTDPTNPNSFWTVNVTAGGGSNTISFAQRANRGFEVQRNYSLFDSNGWIPLDLPANAPFFSSSNITGSVTDAATTNAAYYRVRVFEP
jgi:mono/diheme cytochrome c family protein